MEIEKGALDLLLITRYHITNKRDLIGCLHNASILSKFDIKSGFWQIQLHEKNRYKIAFTVPFGHYEWNVVHFGLNNAHLEFQNIMNDIFNSYTNFSLVYIEYVLIFSNYLEHHFKHLETFQKIVRENGSFVSILKIKLFKQGLDF